VRLLKKLYVHKDVKDDFTAILLEKVSEVAQGNPMDTSTIMGPVIDTPAAEEISRRLKDAVASGARMLTGGKHSGANFEPTVIDNVSIDVQLFAEETFGPVLTMREFERLDQVIAEINASDYGFQAGIYSNDHAQIRHLSRNLEVGGIMINEGPDFRAEHVPFGGIKSSGLGREGVRIALREMSETRVVID